MEFATGALGTLLPKLANLLHGEYKLQKSVRRNIEFLTKELEIMQAALRSVGEVPPEQLPELVKIWARDARELSYDMEDAVDTFLVRVEGPHAPSRRSFRKFIQKMINMSKRHQIGEKIKDVKERAMELAARRDRYMVDTINPVVTLDPRITNLYSSTSDLVGINKAKRELAMKLINGDDVSMQQQRIVSIVGIGGLGKTTLAKVVYDEIKLQFDCTAFVTVSRNPDMKKFLKDMLYELDHRVYGEIHSRSFDEKQLIDIARAFLCDKRYLIIIDDLWNASDWDMIIKYALPDNNTGCRIITTTRQVTVANCVGYAYEMQPLSTVSSRGLLYKRIFGTEDPEKCLDDKLIEVSDKILKKCAGVPLAIVTIASLLASKGRNKTKWDEVYNCIGNGIENNLQVENMRKILSYSYYDLPTYLRNCLLYLSIFPEDFEIEKDRLILLWIAEGFIQQEKHRKRSLFELGESYLNELMNRSMIQPAMHNNRSCRVHDMMLDLICSISREENFVTIFTNMDQTSPSAKVYRLSIQNGKRDQHMTQATRSMPFLRSLVVFPSGLDQMQAIRSVKVLRVLDLQGCNLSQGYCLRYLGSLLHLRYLSLKYTRIDQLPEEVGNLQFLEIMDVTKNRINLLPECVAQLTHLLCLLIDSNLRVHNRIGSLTSLEKLTWLHISAESIDTIESLGFLIELRVLGVMLFTDKWTDKLVESLCKLRKIQRLTIECCQCNRNMGGLDVWVPPPQLHTLGTRNFCWFSVLPAWMNNQDLVCLSIAVRELQQKDLEILGRLPALQTLNLLVNHKECGIVGRRFVVGAGLFPCLIRCELAGFLWPVMFQQGAMPRLRDLGFDFYVADTKEMASSDSGFNCGLGNLQSLQKIFVIYIECGACEIDVHKAKDAVRHAADIHPNQPRVYLL